MTLRARLALGLAIIAIVLVVPLIIARNAMTELHNEVEALQNREIKASLALGTLADALAEVSAREVGLGVVATDSAHRELIAAIGIARNWADSLRANAPDSNPPKRIRARLDSMPSIADRELAAHREGRAGYADTISDREMTPIMRDAERAVKSAGFQISQTTADRVERTETLIRNAEESSLAALVIAIGIATMIAIWLLRSIDRPVRALEKGMRAVAEGDLAHRLDLSPHRKDEFGRLAASFRTMSTQLAELDKLKAEFVSVASHELKTPINVILGYLQLMQDGIYGPLSSKQIEILE